MSESTSHSIRPVTIVLMIAAALTVLLVIAVLIAFLSRPKPITLTITAPSGGVVLCDLVIDGRPDSRRDTAPVTYVFHARQVEFATIPETEDEGSVRVEIRAGGGTGSAGGDGVRGSAAVGTIGGGVSIGNMTSQHVTNMRASRVDAAEAIDAAQVDAAVPQDALSTSPAAR